MIKANELRIGNYITDSTTGERFQVHRETFAFIEGIEDQYEYVPLTPEILERCGFKKGNVQSGGYYGYSNGIIELDKEGTKEYYPELKYLHQLQNLYFALTGQELKIKELQQA